MNQHTRATLPPHQSTSPRQARRRRSAWRQRLVQAERGFVRGVRSDSVFCVHFFIISIIVAAAFVLGFGPLQWITLTGCLTLVLSTEMVSQALKTLVHDPDRPPTAAAERAAAIGTAAVMVAAVGACIVMAIVFAQRLRELFGA